MAVTIQVTAAGNSPHTQLLDSGAATEVLPGALVHFPGVDPELLTFFRDGDDLIVVLPDGQTVRLVGFLGDSGDGLLGGIVDAEGNEILSLAELPATGPLELETAAPEILRSGSSLRPALPDGSDFRPLTPTTPLADGPDIFAAGAPAGAVFPTSSVPVVPLDTAAPAAPSIDLAAASDTGTSDSDNLTAEATPTLEGTAEAGATIEIFDGTASLGTVVANGGGAWSFTAAAGLADGPHDFTAIATDATGNTSPASPVLTVTIDTAAPAAPGIDLAAASDTGASDSDDLTSDTTPTLQGTAEAEATIELTHKPALIPLPGALSNYR